MTYPYASPTVHRRADGFLTIEWPDDTDSPVLISRELLTQIIDRLNLVREES